LHKDWDESAVIDSLMEKAVVTDCAPAEGVVDFLRFLREHGTTAAYATLGHRSSTYDRLDDWPEVFSQFRIGLPGNLLDSSKPESECWLTLARLLGLPPGECAVCDDDVEVCQAAHQAGFKAVLVDLVSDDSMKPEWCRYIIRGWDEMRDLFNYAPYTGTMALPADEWARWALKPVRARREPKRRGIVDEMEEEEEEEEEAEEAPQSRMQPESGEMPQPRVGPEQESASQPNVPAEAPEHQPVRRKPGEAPQRRAPRKKPKDERPKRSTGPVVMQPPQPGAKSIFAPEIEVHLAE
jgi:hypothetical protein